MSTTCERCGGRGVQRAGLWNATTSAYDSPTGICVDCHGTGLLPEPPAAKAEPPGRDPVRRTAECDVDYNLIAQQAEQITALQRENSIIKLSIPLEDDLSLNIDEMCKHLATEQGFTLNGIARLLIECQRRMADDWTEIGRLRRESKALEAQNRALREALTEAQRTAFVAGWDEQRKRRDEMGHAGEVVYAWRDYLAALATPGIAPATPTED